MADRIETVIVGGGQAGLAVSYWLSQLRREHVILERARVAERWRSERWDSLAFQFPNWALSLPGYSYRTEDPNGFALRDSVVEFLEEYATKIKAPLRLGITVTALRHDGVVTHPFDIETDHGHWRARYVVLATGGFQRPAIPAYSAALPTTLLQFHSSAYRNPGQLPPGAVLVIGGGTSGAEIAHELNQSGREVYLSVGSHKKAPRRYRGQDIFWWIEELKFWDRPADLPSSGQLDGVPLLTGLNGGSDIDLRQLSDDGVRLLGRMRGVGDGKLCFASDLEDNLLAGERWFARFKQMMDDHAEFSGLARPEQLMDDRAEFSGLVRPEQPDIERQPRERATPMTPPPELDPRERQIGSIIWATGYRYDFGWVGLPVFKDTGEPLQSRGVTSIPGLYFLGLRRMHTIKSALLSASGVGADAAYIAEQIAAREASPLQGCQAGQMEPHARAPTAAPAL
jgi:putative flavoprotein involved in K+ transport